MSVLKNQPPIPDTKKEKKSFASIADIISQHLNSVSNGKMTQSLAVQKKWPYIVGDTIAKFSKVLYIKQNTLMIAVSNQVWHNELQLMANQILQKAQQQFPALEIKNIKFKIQK